MKKILTIGILMGIIAMTGEKALASVGSAYTGYAIEKLNTNEKLSRETKYETTKLESALKNHR